jgi:predicted fused transcriptional regulator/phosphomethylpyrimidine kinase
MENDHMIELAWYPLLKAQDIVVHKGGVGNQPKKAVFTVQSFPSMISKLEQTLENGYKKEQSKLYSQMLGLN